MSLNPKETTAHVLGDPKACLVYGVKEFWLPVVQGKPIDGLMGQYIWLDDRPGSNKSEALFQKWSEGQPNGLLYQQCVESSQNFWNDLECESVFRCSVCRIPIVQKYQLRGTGSFDREYYLSFNMQLSATKIIFEGQGLNKILWYPLDDITELVDPSENVIKTYNKSPFGLLGDHKSIIQHGYTDELVFTNVGSIFKGHFLQN